MRKKASLTLSGLLLAILGIWFAPELLRGTSDGSASASSTVTTAPDSPSTAAAIDTRVGFTSPRALQEHFAKHGREFGAIDSARYLRLAQELRDAAVGASVREAVRSDGVITRFDARSGAFIAFHDDKSIRTFFKPNDGLRYFERQLDKEH
jgi:pyocin large subunit-like protein